MTRRSDWFLAVIIVIAFLVVLGLFGVVAGGDLR